MQTLRKTSIAELLSWAELSRKERELVRASILVRDSAQAPYSHYHVGVAVRASTGNIWMGCNVERASYTQTSHGEQAAIDQMVAQDGPGTKIVCMSVVGGPDGVPIEIPKRPVAGAEVRWKDICPACGHCLQIIWENCLGDPDVTLLQPFTNGLIVRTTIGDAFPMRFGPDALGIDVSK